MSIDDLDDKSKYEIAQPDISVEKKTPESELAELQSEIISVENENEDRCAATRARYVDLIKKTEKGSKLFIEILRAKKEFDLKFPLTNKESKISNENKSPEEIFSKRIDIPDEEKQYFINNYSKLPDTAKKKYHKRLQEILKNSDLVSTITALRGAAFEISRWAIVLDQGLEKIDPNHGDTVIKVDFIGYEPHLKGQKIGAAVEATHQLKGSPIEIDVPILRNDKMFVYETKKYTRMAYGSEKGSRNQLLKYQSAIEQGKISGATVEISGRIDVDFLQWAMGERVGDFGVAPQVELIYSYILPSGKEYRFVLKQAQGKEGLKFTNEEKYDETDHRIIRGIQQSVVDKRVISLIGEVNIEPGEASDQLKPFLDNPRDIVDLAVFNEYEELRKKIVNRKFDQIYQDSLVNKENRKSAIDPEFANPTFVRNLIQEMQNFLHQNPNIAASKSSYILKPDQIDLAVERTMVELKKIGEFEEKRKQEEDAKTTSDERARLGYKGKSEGVSLDVDHVILDNVYSIVKEGFEESAAIKAVGDQNVSVFFVPHPTREKIFVFKYKSLAEFEKELTVNPELKKIYDKMPLGKKDGLLKTFKEAEFVRSYEWPERFQLATQLPKMLENQDRRYLEIQVSDPRNQENPIIRHTNTNEAAVKRTEVQLIKENVKRAREYVKGSKREGQEKKNIKNIEADLAVLELESEAKTKAMQKVVQERAREIQEQINPLINEQKKLEREKAPAELINNLTRKIEELKQLRMAVFEDLRNVSNEGQQKERVLYEELEHLYKKIIPTIEWNSFAQNIIKRVDQNIIKFIYVVTADGSVVVQEEIIRGDVTGRAAHSELARGRNVYGAGEIAFEKRGKEWVLVEINNGSGHYRPDASSTLPYVKNLLAKKGIDVSNVGLINSIMRGAPLKDVSVF